MIVIVGLMRVINVVPNLDAAVKYLAGKALKTGRNGAWLDSLATAYAECGDFEQAVLVGTEAYQWSRPPNDNFRIRVEAYRMGKTYADWRESTEDSK